MSGLFISHLSCEHPGGCSSQWIWFIQMSSWGHGMTCCSRVPGGSVPAWQKERNEWIKERQIKIKPTKQCSARCSSSRPRPLSAAHLTIFNVSSQEAEAGKSQVQDQLRLYSETPCLKKKKKVKTGWVDKVQHKLLLSRLRYFWFSGCGLCQLLNFSVVAPRWLQQEHGYVSIKLYS